MRGVLDTNVLISALLWHGKAHKLISLIENDKITPCFSLETLEELQGVLSRSKFKDKLREANVTTENIIIQLLLKSAILKLPKSKLKVVKEDPTDDKFLHLALVIKTKYLVSGDKHLLKLGKFANIQILSITEFLTLFQSR